MGIRGVMVDISERKLAEDKLRESEEKFRLTFDASPDSVNINRLQDGLYIDINQGFIELTGYTREDVIGRTSLEINIWDDINDRKKLVDVLISNGFCENLQAQFRRKNGSVTTALMSARTIQLQGEPHIISITRDISERIKAEIVVRENESKFRNLFDLSPQAVALTEVRSGRLVDVNDKLCELTKYSRNEILGKTTTEIGFYSRKDRDRFVQELSEYGQVNGLEMEFYSKNGVVLNALMFAKFITIQDTPLILTIFHDITEQKHLRESIAQAQKMESIGSLAGGIAHDFNNILFPVVGMAEMLVEDLPDGSSLQQNAKEIFKAGKRGSDLVKQILAFSRHSEQKLLPTRAQKVLGDVLRLCRRTIPTDIEIEQRIETDCSLVMADPTQLHQVGMNLITNAFHAVEESSGKISVVLEQVTIDGGETYATREILSGQYVKLTVSDNGVGIDPSIRDKIFDPYFTTKGQGKGTGLGLAVVYGIVKDWGGEIAVHTELGNGTTFELFIPVIQDIEETDVPDARSSYLTGTETILLVDDEEAVAGLEKRMLERLGYKVVMRTASLEAFEAFRSNPKSFELVISDMSMPNMTGDRLAKQILEMSPDIPIILCTGFSERINQNKADSIGVKALLMKPVAMSDLSQIVRNVLDKNKK